LDIVMPSQYGCIVHWALNYHHYLNLYLYKCILYKTEIGKSI